MGARAGERWPSVCALGAASGAVACLQWVSNRQVAVGLRDGPPPSKLRAGSLTTAKGRAKSAPLETEGCGTQEVKMPSFPTNGVGTRRRRGKARRQKNELPGGGADGGVDG